MIQRMKWAAEKVFRTINAPSCYPEQKRKPTIRRAADVFCWLFQKHEIHNFYNIYGLDLQGSSDTEYLDYRSFGRDRSMCNRMGGNMSQVVLLRDKLLFFRYMKERGFPVPEIYAVVRNGTILSRDLKPLKVADSRCFPTPDFFLKDIGGECASFVKHVNFSELEKLLPTLNKGFYIIQEPIRQSQNYNTLFPGSINTLRVVTVYNQGEPYVLSTVLRIGTKASGCVDNWAQGGLAIGVNSDGTLKDRAFYKPNHGTVAFEHPDTKLRFEGFKLQGYQEALQLACEAHKEFYNTEFIGWDIAMTEQGPCIIEGNDNWEVTLMQAADHPLKSAWQKAVLDWRRA